MKTAPGMSMSAQLKAPNTTFATPYKKEQKARKMIKIRGNAKFNVSCPPHNRGGIRFQTKTGGALSMPKQRLEREQKVIGLGGTKNIPIRRAMVDKHGLTAVQATRSASAERKIAMLESHVQRLRADGADPQTLLLFNSRIKSLRNYVYSDADDVFMDDIPFTPPTEQPPPSGPVRPSMLTPPPPPPPKSPPPRKKKMREKEEGDKGKEREDEKGKEKEEKEDKMMEEKMRKEEEAIERLNQEIREAIIQNMRERMRKEKEMKRLEDEINALLSDEEDDGDGDLPPPPPPPPRISEGGGGEPSTPQQSTTTFDIDPTTPITPVNKYRIFQSVGTPPLSPIFNKDAPFLKHNHAIGAFTEQMSMYYHEFHPNMKPDSELVTNMKQETALDLLLEQNTLDLSDIPYTGLEVDDELGSPVGIQNGKFMNMSTMSPIETRDIKVESKAEFLRSMNYILIVSSPIKPQQQPIFTPLREKRQRERQSSEGGISSWLSLQNWLP